MTVLDVEKAPVAYAPQDGETDVPKANLSPDTGRHGWLWKLERFSGVEGRGIQRVTAQERQPLSKRSYLQIAILWVSVNLCANNVALGVLGPAIFTLSFKDSALCAAFGALVGSIPTAYIATWGPISGNRTLVCTSPDLEAKRTSGQSTDLDDRFLLDTPWVGGRVSYVCCSAWSSCWDTP